MTEDGMWKTPTLTITPSRGQPVIIPAGENLSLPLEPPRLHDIELIGGFYAPYEINVLIVLHEDGSWEHLDTTYGGGSRHHLHLDERQLFMDDKSIYVQFVPRPDPTDAQQEAVVRWFCDQDAAPYRLAPGSTLVAWAFGDENLNDLVAKYGLTRPLLA